MINLTSTNEFDAFKSIFTQLLFSNQKPSDSELIRESTLSCEIIKSITNERILIDGDGTFSTSFNYSKYVQDGDKFAQEECIYWHKEFFESNKIPEIIEYLKENTYSKRAISMIWQDKYMDLNGGASCISYAFFRIDNGKLNMNVHMRANDGYRCLLIDLDSLNALQKYVADKLKLEVGTFTHFVDSLHFYKLAENDIYELLYKLKDLTSI